MRKKHAIMALLAATMSTSFVPSMASDRISEVHYQERNKSPFLLNSSLINHGKIKGHPINLQAKNRHTNRLRSRKQAKLRAKRKAK